MIAPDGDDGHGVEGPSAPDDLRRSCYSSEFDLTDFSINKRSLYSINETNNSIEISGANVNVETISPQNTFDTYALENGSVGTSDLDELYPDRISYADSISESEDNRQELARSHYRQMLYGKPNELYKHSTWYCGYYCGPSYTSFLKRLRVVLMSNYFKYGILALILANAIILSLWKQPPPWDKHSCTS